jgi:hypothetical protein
MAAMLGSVRQQDSKRKELTLVHQHGILDGVNCSICQHPEHGDGPCTTCATSNGTCWQRIQVVGGDGDQSAVGKIQMATGVETRPCMTCSKWDNVGPKRMSEYFLSKGLELDADGKFITPIVKDFNDRTSMRLNPHDYGFCKRDLIPTDLQSTCDGWSPTKSLVELQRKLRQ